MAYQAKSITGAQRRVRDLEKIVERMGETMAQLDRDRRLLARLAADGPAFFNPIDVAEAKKIRNAILLRDGMNPDGSFVKH